MKTRKVVVLPYDVAWQSAFEKIKGEIEEEMAKFQKWREEQAQKEGEKTNKAKSA